MLFKMIVSVKYLDILIFYCLIFLSCSVGMTVYEFEPIQVQRSLLQASPIQTHTVSSMVECAQLCCSDSICRSFSFDCVTTSIDVACYLFDTSVDSISELGLSSQCYVQRKGFSLAYTVTVPGPLYGDVTTNSISSTSFSGTTATPSFNGRFIRDIIYGPFNMCSQSPSSQKDFIVIANKYVYIYDEVEDLTVAPCKGPLQFRTVFNGFSDITISDVSGVLLYQNFVELYSFETRRVYRWQMNSGELTKHSSNDYASFLGLSTNAPIKTRAFEWCDYRAYMGQERHFYLGNNELFMLSDQYGESFFTKDEEVINTNNFNMNPWGKIPDGIMASSGFSDEPSKNFILIDADFTVYLYELNHDADNNNPAQFLTPMGTLG